jgi:hypothetical protein
MSNGAGSRTELHMDVTHAVLRVILQLQLQLYGPAFPLSVFRLRPLNRNRDINGDLAPKQPLAIAQG